MIMSGRNVLAIPGKRWGFSRIEPSNTFEMEQDPMVLAPDVLCLSYVCGKTLAKE